MAGESIIVPNRHELELNKTYLEIYHTKILTLVQLRYQLIGLVVTILSISIGAVGLLINPNSDVAQSPDYHLIYTILFLWIVFSISLILIWRFIVNLLHNEEYGYCQQIVKLGFLIEENTTESALHETKKLEMGRRINECPKDPGIQKFEKWISLIVYILFAIGIVFLLLNHADYDIFNDSYRVLLSLGGILLIGISGFVAIFVSQKYLKEQTQ
jgi:cytochrome bd-type quinol oxidase subunit 2